MKILAIDYGKKRVGLAVGDTETKLALPYGVLSGRSSEILLEQLQKIILEEDIGTIVLGEPFNVSGANSQQTDTSRAFAQFLQGNISVPVVLFDERFTSQRADTAKNMVEGSKTRSRDELAAMFLLQDYLEKVDLKS